MKNQPHPARSIAFLSRLHDGDLSPAERAHFESHRAHCGECRKAAADFETTLAAFRTTGTSPPAPDLAARILRKLESVQARRRPFGVVFGIDAKWAGAFTAALVAVLIGYAVVERDSVERKISITFAQPARAPVAAPADAVTQLSASSPARSVTTPQPRSDSAKREFRQTRAAARAEAAAGRGGETPVAKAARANSTALELDKVDAAPPAAPASVAERAKEPSSEQALGGKRGAASAGGLVSEPTSSVRIVVQPIDQLGPAPEVLNSASVRMSPQDAGSYVLVVNPQGIPLEIGRPAAAKSEADASVAGSAETALRGLRFAASDRPRRLLVRIDAVAPPNP